MDSKAGDMAVLQTAVLLKILWDYLTQKNAFRGGGGGGADNP